MLNKREQNLYTAFVTQKNIAEPSTNEAFLQFGRAVIKRDYGNRQYIFEQTEKVKKFCLDAIRDRLPGAEKCADVYYNTLLFEAQNRQLDSYLLYIERYRDPKDKFYINRRRQFRKHGVVQALQGMLDDEYDILCISMVPGSGKAQPLYSKVLTPSGFKQMGDIHTGDEVVAANGRVANVVGVYPQGKRPIYELTFDDGSKCRCSDNHLWTVQTRDDRRRSTKEKKYRCRTLTLSQMMNHLTIGGDNRKNYSIEYVGKIDFPQNENLLLHPYVMGAFLADGGLSSGTPQFSTGDSEVLDLLNDFLPDGYYMKHHDRCTWSVNGHEGNNCKAGSLVTKAFKAYGLYGHTSEEKFIPREYLYSSYEQRMWLLRGLLDCDGWANGADVGYCTVSKQLADDVVELVHSLGGYASVRIKKAGYKKDGEYRECKDAYTLCIQFSSDSDKIFALPRKRDAYNPKRASLKRFLCDVKYVGEEECQCIYIDDPCHLYITDDYIITHNTTLEEFFASGVMGWFPKDYSLFYSHSADITRMFYDSVLNILTDEQEYAWNEVFPYTKISKTNAKAEQINVGKFKPFPTLQTTSIGASNAGKVRASKYLYCDDLIAKLEDALNKNTLDKIWGAYTVDARQRKVEDSDGHPCKEIHIATRWSVNDQIGRLQRIYSDNPRVKFIAVPDIDPETGESNFDYAVGGFTKEFFADQALLMDDISYKCLYKQQPIEREGLLYHEDELRRYTTLPEKEPDAVWAVCDVKNKGIDFMSMPVVKQYGSDYYLCDVVFDDNTDFGIQTKKCGDVLIENEVQSCQFESNAGGDRFALDVTKYVDANGGKCNITTKPTESNKETKIIANAFWVKKHILFKSKELYSPKSDYGKFVSDMLSYSQMGHNPHDDSVDSLAMLALFVTKDVFRRQTVIIQNPFM